MYLIWTQEYENGEGNFNKPKQNKKQDILYVFINYNVSSIFPEYQVILVRHIFFLHGRIPIFEHLS